MPLDGRRKGYSKGEEPHRTAAPHPAYDAIDLVGCIWLTDDLVKQFCNLKNVTQANFGNTNITSHSAGHLKNLINLKALHLGSTKIKGQYIV